jgi:hypothetical protein
MAEPRNAKLSGTILWSDGSNFNGFAIIGLVLPTSSGVAWPELTIEPNSPRQRLPLWLTVPIINGAYNQQIGVWFNEDIDPPNSKYCSYFFDSSMKQLAGPTTPADFFTVTVDPTPLAAPTLTVPIAGVTIPVPST